MNREREALLMFVVTVACWFVIGCAVGYIVRGMVKP